MAKDVQVCGVRIPAAWAAYIGTFARPKRVNLRNGGFKQGAPTVHGECEDSFVASHGMTIKEWRKQNPAINFANYFRTWMLKQWPELKNEVLDVRDKRQPGGRVSPHLRPEYFGAVKRLAQAQGCSPDDIARMAVEYFIDHPLIKGQS
ncbi:hypothetical protein [Paraburkholderia unamae]|uniref:Uncharacterized protein n=1 Tax=Paraburkholderia unamae TaxID=219649 RepID=A0ACC6RGZ0_9BURK